MPKAKKDNHQFGGRIIKYSLNLLFLSIVLILVSAAVNFAFVNQAHAASSWWEKAQSGGLQQVGLAYGTSVPRDIRLVVVDYIKIILGFLGILSVILILYAGFKWMTAGGKEEQVADAKKIIIACVIGLIIILSAYVIANYVINYIYSATTGYTPVWQD